MSQPAASQLPLPSWAAADEAARSAVSAELHVSPLDEHNVKLLDNVHPHKWPMPDMMEKRSGQLKKYNLVVLGAGAGGLVSAAGAAGVGAKVAIVEKHLMGGDCLNVGCVPSKALIRCAHVARSAREAAAFGVNVGDVSVDFHKIMQRMRALRAGISPTDSCARFQKQLGIDVFQGMGVFKSPSTMEVNGQTLRFSAAVIATGATACVPDIPGLKLLPYLTNETVFNLTELPTRLLVLGSGPIGLELAQAMAVFGSKVTVIARSACIMGKEDPEAALIVKEQMEQDGVHFMLASTPQSFKREADGSIAATVKTADREVVVHADAVLVALGRLPTVEGLGLQAAGVEYCCNMGIQVNDKLQTTASHIFAVGDCASLQKFTHAADFMARTVIRNALFFGSGKMSALLIPRATFTEPEVASVGKSERELKDEHTEYVVYKRELSEVDRCVLDGETQGFVKILTAKNGTILGGTIVAGEAGNMISEITVAMQAGMSLGSLASVIHPYPTQAEAIRQTGDLFNRTKLTPFVKGTFDKLLKLRRRG